MHQEINCIWNPKDKIYYPLFLTVVKLGDEANAGIPAPLKLLRTILYLSSLLLALPSPEQEGLWILWPRSPHVGGEGGVAVAIAPCGVQLEQPVLPVCAAGVGVRQMGLGMFKYGGG